MKGVSVIVPAKGRVAGVRALLGSLEAAAREYGRPKRIRVDNGLEFVSRDLDLWGWQYGVVLDYSRRASPPTTRSPKASTAASGRNA